MKRYLVLAGLLIGLVVLALLAIVLLVDVDAYKPRIEAAASDALGLEVKIRGKASLSLFPAVAISLEDVGVRNRGTDLVKVGSLRVGVRLLPLLRRRVQVTEFVLVKPEVFVEKGRDGRYNYETPPKGAGPGAGGPALSVAGSAVRGGRFLYVDQGTGKRIEIDGADLSVRDLSVGGAAGAGFPKSLSFSGELRIRKLKAGNVSVSDIQARVTAAGGIYQVRSLEMKVFGGSGQGGIEANFTEDATAVAVRFTLSKVRSEDLLSAVSQKKFLSGPLTISPNLAFRGKGAEAIRRSMKGEVSVRGEDLTVQGLDIDAILARADESRKLNLADVGAFLLAGPLGAVVTKGYEYGGLYAASRAGETRIARLVSDWSVAGGVADARDVAFATAKNRIALKGKLDIVNDRFVGITVAALDGKGCATLRQRIDGPFANPTLNKVSVLESAAGPLLGLFEQTEKLLARVGCEPFYGGSVEHPR